MVMVSLPRGAMVAGEFTTVKLPALLPVISVAEMIRLCPPPRFETVSGLVWVGDPVGKLPRSKKPGAEMRGS